MIIDENWAIAPERAQAFFEELPGAVPQRTGLKLTDVKSGSPPLTAPCWANGP